MKAHHSFMFLAVLGLTFGADVAQGSEVAGVEASMDAGDSVLMLYEGYPLKFHCNLTKDGGDLTTSGGALDWFKNDKEIVSDDRIKIFQDNFTMIFTEAKKEDAGDYKCQVKTDEDIKPSREFKVIFLILKKMEKSLEVTEKQAIKIECPVEGNPTPVVAWLKDQKPMEGVIANDSRMSLGPNTKGVPNGTITIAYSEMYDRGNYTCNITTLLQTHERWSFLRVKDTYAALWPFIGIVVEVVLLGIIIVVFEKRRAKAEFDESDTDQGNDQ